MRPIRLELSAVIIALRPERDRLDPVVAMTGPERLRDLPTTAFDPDRDRTLELSLRDWVLDSTGLRLGHVEQLYTFGDRARSGETVTDTRAPHVVSIGYLALTRPPEGVHPEIGWTDWSRHFPWEDRRSGSTLVEGTVLPHLHDWIGQTADTAMRARRAERLRLCFALDDNPWAPELALERYELLYGARLVAEAWRDRGVPVPTDLPPLGAPLPRDHRRILATAIGRLRGKLKYRPVLFELTSPTFTLLELQRAAEAVSGVVLHKQNFRRTVERSGLVEPTGTVSLRHGGRPAAEYRYAPAATSERRAARGPGVGPG